MNCPLLKEKLKQWVRRISHRFKKKEMHPCFFKRMEPAYTIAVRAALCGRPLPNRLPTRIAPAVPRPSGTW